MAVQNNQIWTGLQALPTYDLFAQLYLQPLDPIRANYTTIPYKNLQLGTFWLTTTTVTGKARQGNLWYLANLTLPPHIEGHWIQISGSTGTVEFLTGNTGGPVGPDGSANINVIGDGVGITIAGNAGTNTLTASLVGGGEAAQSFPTDSGIATPAAGVLNVFGGTANRDINTSGSGNTIHIDLNNAIILGDLSSIIGSPALTLTTGDATLSAGNINLPSSNAAGNQGIVKFGGTRTITIFSADQNVLVGTNAGNLAYTSGVGVANTALGGSSLSNFTTGVSNVACGFGALGALTTGSSNVALGSLASSVLLTGSFNVTIGANTNAYTGAESSNVLINNPGTVGESNVCRIGAATGGGVQDLNKTFIQGIRGITTDVNNAIAVLIDSAGQLGTVSSSARYKENIQPMNGISEAIMHLKPVIFNYKTDESKRTNYGLIAEEVAQVMPNLVIYDEIDEPETVRYHELPVLLLNELQKQRKQIIDLISHIGVLEQEVMQLKARRK